MSAVNAIESLCGVEVPEPIRLLRRLLYCGEWIESHALHVYMLHAPDFLGYDGAVELARDAPDAVERGLALKQHRQRGDGARRRSRDPPDQRPRRRLLPGADPPRAAVAGRAARARARGGARDGPLDGRLRLPRAGRRVRARRALPSRATTRSSAAGSAPTRGLDIAPARVRRALRGGARRAVERPALAAYESEAPTCAARWRASPRTTNSCRRSPSRRPARPGSRRPCRDAFRSIVVRSVELVYACDEALRLIEAYEEPDAPFVAVEPVAGRRLRRERGAARPPLPPLPHRRRRHDPRRQDRAADVAEPARDRGRPARGRRALRRPGRRRAARARASRRSATTTPASRARRTS